MTLPFTPSEFARPFTMVTAGEAADIVTVALHGPWVYQHQHPVAERREEAQQAQEQALRNMYEFLRAGELRAYVEDPDAKRFLRVPREYFLDDGWAFGRCFRLSKLMNEGIPPRLDDRLLLFVQVEIKEWVDAQNRELPVRRGPKPKFDWSAFDAEATKQIEEHGGYMTGEFSRPQLCEIMRQWCSDNWGEELVPSSTMLDDRFAKIERETLDETRNLKSRN